MKLSPRSHASAWERGGVGRIREHEQALQTHRPVQRDIEFLGTANGSCGHQRSTHKRTIRERFLAEHRDPLQRTFDHHRLSMPSPFD